MVSLKHFATWDIETDPFKAGREIRPFMWDFFNGKQHVTDWNKFDEEGCMLRFALFLESLTEPHIIYAHNGGKFDFLFLYRHFKSCKLFVIGTRIVSMQIGIHELRDSYAAVPVPLRKFLKEDIDYNKLESDLRYSHAAEIIRYQKVDTESLFTLMVGYWEEFGDCKTMASAAMKKFQQHATFDRMSEMQDRIYRQYYFGGRVECFRKGVVKDSLNLYDVNSMYPAVMGSHQHPTSIKGHVGKDVTEQTSFLQVVGQPIGNIGPFAVRSKDGGISFPREAGTFNTSIHEFKIAMQYGLFRLHRIVKTYNFKEHQNFAPFVTHYFEKRKLAEAAKDKARNLFYKLVPNSSYGKFAQNPSRFREYQIVVPPDDLDGEKCLCAKVCACKGWRIESRDTFSGIEIWTRRSTKNRKRGLFNVAIGASITGAARSVLLEALCKSEAPVYCDTDSITCRSTEVSKGNSLGQWKHDAAGHTMGIGGKKMYCLLNDDSPAKEDDLPLVFVPGHGYAVKMASKGARLSASEIWKVANGGKVTFANQAPSMRFFSHQSFLVRNIQAT